MRGGRNAADQPLTARQLVRIICAILAVAFIIAIVANAQHAQQQQTRLEHQIDCSLNAAACNR